MIERVRALLRRLLWLSGTAIAYAMLDRFAVNFQVEPGVSVLFPATAAAIVACVHGGVWGVVGVFIGSLVNPVVSGTFTATSLAFAAINAFEGAIPWLAFRLFRNMRSDLSDLRSLGLFIVTGTILNTGLSASLGTSLVADPEATTMVVHQLFVWWIADFSAAVLLATPVLAFAHAPLRRISPSADPLPPDTLYISGTLQVTAAIVILGWSSSAFVRYAVSDRIESNRLSQQERAFEARNAVNSLHSNFLRAAALESSYIDDNDRHTLEDFEETRELHFGLLSEVDRLISTSTPASIDQFNRLRDKTVGWFARARRELSGRSTIMTAAAEGHQLSREFLNLKASIENADALEWVRFGETRKRLAAFDRFVDSLVFVILLLAFGTLILRISKPLDQLSTSIELLGSGSLPPATHGTWTFMELQTVDHALSSAARELRLRETELQKQTQEALEASRHQSAFLAKMSHELRTPLNSIIGFADLLRDSEAWDDERRRSAVDNVAGSGRLLLTMIDDLLDIAKLESGSVSVRIRACELGEIVRSAVSAVASLVAEKSQRIDIRIPERALDGFADPEKLGHVLIRLLTNASKFSPQGELIVVRAGIQDGICEIDVEDRGVGIRPEDQQRIFETFEQVYQKGVLSQGAGLGLTVAKRFTEAQGGTILVRSNPLRGATFTVRIPMEGDQLAG